jgi:hypothetical protein
MNPKTARHVGDGHKREGALNRKRTLQPKMPQRTDLTEMPSHLRDDGGSDSPVSLVSSRSRTRDTEPRSLHDKEKMIESQVRFRLDMYHVFAAEYMCAMMLDSDTSSAPRATDSASVLYAMR